MRLGRRTLAVLGAGAILAAGSLAIVSAQPAETPPQEEAPPSTTPPQEEAPPDVSNAPTAGTMSPIPDSASSGGGSRAGPSAASASGPPQPGQTIRLELPPLRIIEPGQPIPLPPRTRAQYAIVEALDKVTAQSIRFAAPVGQPVRFENLIFTVRACEATATNVAAPEAAAYMEIISQPPERPGVSTPPARQVFRGWMFASSPALNPLEHPVYDAWVIACSTTPPRA
jgi:hypothetical protein